MYGVWKILTTWMDCPELFAKHKEKYYRVSVEVTPTANNYSDSENSATLVTPLLVWEVPFWKYVWHDVHVLVTVINKVSQKQIYLSRSSPNRWALDMVSIAVAKFHTLAIILSPKISTAPTRLSIYLLLWLIIFCACDPNGRTCYLVTPVSVAPFALSQPCKFKSWFLRGEVSSTWCDTSLQTVD